MKNSRNRARKTQRPQRIVRSNTPPPLALRSILVPLDFSPQAESALAYATALGRRFGAKISLIHVIEPIATPDFEASFPLEIEQQQTKESCQRALRKIGEKFGLGSELLQDVIVRFGKPYNEIAEAARKFQSDLIVIATHGYTGLTHAFLGSTAERVVRHAPCPVLVVRVKARARRAATDKRSTRR